MQVVRNFKDFNDNECFLYFNYFCTTCVSEFDQKKANRFTYGNSTYEISSSTVKNHSLFLLYNKILIVFKADWYLAKINCRLEGMELVSIETRGEQEAITAKISKPTS